MKSILDDIRQRLRRNEYHNEEHVRLCIVARLLEALGWNIWDPTQVDAECATAPLEDCTKVDFALSFRPYSPDVFVEVKRVGQVEAQLERVEKQLRDYNRDHSARFTVITDGQKWWFYYVLTPGEFREKRFATINLLDNEKNQDELEKLLWDHLAKTNIDSGHVEELARTKLKYQQKARAFQQSYPEARRLVQEPPFPALPEVIVSLMASRGYSIDLDEARQLLKSPPSNGEVLPFIRSREPVAPTSAGPLITSKQWTDHKPISFSFLGTQHSVKTFKEILTGLAAILYQEAPDQFWNRIRQLGSRYYAQRPDGLTSPRQIAQSGIWMATNYSANDIQKRCHELLRACGHHPDQLIVQLRRER